MPYLVALSSSRWLVTLPSMTHIPPAAHRPTVWRRVSNSINNNPIGTLCLATAIIAGVFYGTLHDAISDLHSAATRIDRLASDVGEIKGHLATIERQTSKIDAMNSSLIQVRNFDAAFDQQLRALKSYEIRLVESYGVPADSQLIVQMERGRVLAFPLTPEKQTELVRAGFVQTDVFLTQPVRTAGFSPPPFRATSH
jgi:hypothetical protein